MSAAASECLFDRCSVGVFPVSALVQPDAGGVQIDGGDVFPDGKVQGMNGAGFREPAGMVDGFQPFHRCLFQDGLAVRHAVQLGVQRMSLDREGIVLANPLFQRNAAHALKQLLEAVGGKLPQLNEHTFCHREGEVCLGDGERIAAKQDTAVLGCDVGSADF